MSKKKNKRKIDASHLLNFKTPMLEYYDKWSPAFSELEKKIGELPLNLVMKYMDYNEWEDTRYCFGFNCSERIYNHSKKYYCNTCFYELHRDGFIFCKKCGLLEEECFHCIFCKKVQCICKYCNKCGEQERDCDCYLHCDFGNFY